MSANPVSTVPRTFSDHGAEAPLYELAEKYPDFDWKETAVDRFWLAEQQAKGLLDAFYGKVVAVYQQEIIGAGDNYIEMLLELSPKYNVHPGRIVVVYLESEEDFPRDEDMTTNPPPIPEFGPSPKVQAQVAELRALEKQFPEPTWEEVRSDWEALYAAVNTGTMYDHFGRFIAFCEGKLVGVGEDQLELRIRLTHELQRHPERFVITFNG